MPIELDDIKKFLEDNPEILPAIAVVLRNVTRTVEDVRVRVGDDDPLGKVFEGARSIKRGQEVEAQAREAVEMIGSFLFRAIKSLL